MDTSRALVLLLLMLLEISKAAHVLVRVFVHQYDWTHVALRALSNCDSIAGDCLDFSLTTTVSQQGSTCFNLMISHLVLCVCGVCASTTLGVTCAG
ncbi:MAG: hypothetical protein QWI73_03740 [Alphaproteobacteria bacterium]|nr:hypothetical protein [Alphaproteobacteria bacterium]